MVQLLFPSGPNHTHHHITPRLSHHYQNRLRPQLTSLYWWIPILLFRLRAHYRVIPNNPPSQSRPSSDPCPTTTPSAMLSPPPWTSPPQGEHCQSTWYKSQLLRVLRAPIFHWRHEYPHRTTHHSWVCEWSDNSLCHMIDIRSESWLSKCYWYCLVWFVPESTGRLVVCTYRVVENEDIQFTVRYQYCDFGSCFLSIVQEFLRGRTSALIVFETRKI